MLYRLDSVTKAFGPKEVLRGASWQHDPGRVVGLVGRNGAGKTTVLKIIQGVLEPDAGRRLVAGGTSFASLEQAVEPEGDEPLRAFVARAQEGLRELEGRLRALEDAMARPCLPGLTLQQLLAEHDEVREHFERQGGYEAGSRLERVLGGVGLPASAWDRPVGELSGGQKHRAQLARLLLTDAIVLLLDEPTNHLDVNGIEFLEGWLGERKLALQAALVVSHDRRFLDAVADRILEVAHGRLEEYPGGYETYRRLKAERDRLRAKEFEQQRKLVERTEDFIRRNIAGQKTKQAQGRRKMLARLERVEAPREDANEVAFRFEQARQSGERVLEPRDLRVGYSETGPLFPPLSFLVRRGERVAVWGPNGSGKTTLLKTLARLLPPLGGSVAYGAGVLLGYYDQEMTDLPSSSSLLDAVMDLDPSLTTGEARDFLALFDFRADEVEQRVATLSGGEKGRLSLARIVFGGANVLLLDEPTNHLDLDARERLEEALADFEGSVLFVSHDRWFVDRVATHVLLIGGGSADLLPGNYTSVVRRREDERSSAPVSSKVEKGAVRPDRTAERRRARQEKRVAELEAEIAALEESHRALEQRLGDPEVYTDATLIREVTAEQRTLKARLEERLAEWEEILKALEVTA